MGEAVKGYNVSLIDGDVSVGHDLKTGGNATVAGSARIKKDLIIDGWLEAKNIKCVNKGVFTSLEKLEEAYPRPRKGWFAIVSTSVPGALYVGEKGKWVPTGGTGGQESDIPHVSHTTDGLMYASDKVKIDRYADTFAENPTATDTTAGLMSAEDKKRLYAYDGTARYTNIPYAPSGISELDMGYAGTDAAEVRLNAATGNLVIIPQGLLGGGIAIPSNVKGYKAWNAGSDLQNGLSSEGYKHYGSEIYVGGDIWQFSGTAWAQINGAGQGKVYTKQDSALTWTIAHHMGKRPAVSVVNAAGYEVECDVRYVDGDTVLLTFATVFFGKAILN